MFRFREFNCVAEYPTYINGGTAIYLVDADDHSPIAVASSWIEGLTDGEIAIKDYSENEGMLDVLLQAGLITPPHRYLDGFPIVKLNQ